MFYVCTTSDTARMDTILKFLPHTRQHGCIDILHCFSFSKLFIPHTNGVVCRRVLCILCTVTTDLLVWYSNTQNDFFPGEAILSLHTLTSPSGRNVNYNEKQLIGKKFLSCSFYLYRFHKYVSCGFPIINFCNPGVHYGTSYIML
jgi:hypothetical protein